MQRAQSAHACWMLALKEPGTSGPQAKGDQRLHRPEAPKAPEGLKHKSWSLNRRRQAPPSVFINLGTTFQNQFEGGGLKPSPTLCSMLASLPCREARRKQHDTHAPAPRAKEPRRATRTAVVGLQCTGVADLQRDGAAKDEADELAKTETG